MIRPESRVPRWGLVLGAIGLLVILAQVCAALDTDESPAPTPTVPRSDQEDLVENTREVSYDLCRNDGPAQLARGMRVPDLASDLDALAREFSLGSKAGPHRDAAHAGCLEGLADHEADK